MRILAVVAILVAAPAQALTLEYTQTIPFAESFEDSLTFISGAVAADVPNAPGPYVFLNTTGLTVAGLTKVCWDVGPPCVEGMGLRLVVRDGGAVAFHFPGNAAGSLQARHSLSFFVDVRESLDFDDFRTAVGRDLAGVHVGASMSFTKLPVMPTTSILALSDRNAAGMLLLTTETSVTVQGGDRPYTVSSRSLALSFQGSPAIAPFDVEASLLPFPAGATATFTPADGPDAAAGLDLRRVTRMMDEVENAFNGRHAAEPEFDDRVDALQPLLGAVLAGAILAPPGNMTSPAEFTNLTAFVSDTTLFRFDELTAVGNTESSVSVRGSGPLLMQDGRIEGGPALAGIMPWWSWVLWIAAIGVWIWRRVAKPPVENERWDQYRWVGWVAGPLAGILLFVLWDSAVHSFWGLSILRGGGGSAGFVFLLLAEVVVGILAYLAVVMPLSSLLKSGARFGKQGRFMGLHRPAAMLLGFLIGSTLLVSYTDFFLQLFA